MDEPVLDARGLAFRYPGTTAFIFDGLDVTVGRGEMVAVLGRSGCGKSTLLYVLGLFLHPTSGGLAIHGQETGRLGDRERSLLRSHDIGFVLQDAALHGGWSMLENVAEGALYSGATYAQAMARAGALLDEYGISGIAAHRPAQVSGGQAQRAALCRALIRRPTLVLADEPTGNLDAANADAVIAGLRQAADEGAAVIVVTHAPAVASASDRTVHLG